jgi:hypothetical protein
MLDRVFFTLLRAVSTTSTTLPRASTMTRVRPERSAHDRGRDDLGNGSEQASSEVVNSPLGYVPFSAQKRCERGSAAYIRVVEL